MQIVYLHGLNSSHRSFNFVQLKLPPHDAIAVNYGSHQPLADSIDEVRKKIPKTGSFSIVGHSLGGLLAVIMAAEYTDRVNHVVSISSPFGGSKAAVALRWIPGHPKVLNDLIPTSSRIGLLPQLKLQAPLLSIISTGGSLPTTQEPNDSVVTIASQKALPFGRKHEIKANHFEILTHEKTASVIEQFIFTEEAILKDAA